MIDIYFRAPSTEAFMADFPEFFTTDEDGQTVMIQATHAYALDHVGRIVDVPAEIDDDGNVVSEATFFPGDHWNLRCLDDTLAADILASAFEHGTVIVNPQNPARMWA